MTDEPPPLEDLSELVTRLNEAKIKRENLSSMHERLDGDNSAKTGLIEQADSSKVNNKQYGGMKKGFLSAASNTEKQKLPNDNLVFKEVQDAVNQPPLDWVTPDLFEAMSKHPDLMKKLSDPKYERALQDLQADPKGAVAKYENDPAMQQFLKTFCHILGNHFTSLAEAQESSSQPRHKPEIEPIARTTGDTEVDQIMNNLEVREILLKPQTQDLLEALRTRPLLGQAMLINGSDELKRDVEKMVKFGLLSVQTQS